MNILNECLKKTLINNLTCPSKVSWAGWNRRVFGSFRVVAAVLCCRSPRNEECSVHPQQLRGEEGEQRGSALIGPPARWASLRLRHSRGSECAARLFRLRAADAFRCAAEKPDTTPEHTWEARILANDRDVSIWSWPVLVLDGLVSKCNIYIE